MSMSIMHKSSTDKTVLRQKVSTEIAKICKNNKHQMKPREYRAIADCVLSLAPAHFLVFGLGRDTPLWKMCNHGGDTVFLENSQEWIDLSKKLDPNTIVHKVEYSTRRTEWKEIINNKARLQLDLPADIVNKQWDVILVDSPGGAFDSDPGRMQSIFAAAQLHPTHFFLHDCNRKVEKVYFNAFFKEAHKKIRKLWYASCKCK